MSTVREVLPALGTPWIYPWGAVSPINSFDCQRFGEQKTSRLGRLNGKYGSTHSYTLSHTRLVHSCVAFLLLVAKTLTKELDTMELAYKGYSKFHQKWVSPLDHQQEHQFVIQNGELKCFIWHEHDIVEVIEDFEPVV